MQIFISERLKDRPGRIINQYNNIMVNQIEIIDNKLVFLWQDYISDKDDPMNPYNDIIDYEFFDRDSHLKQEEILITEDIIINFINDK